MPPSCGSIFRSITANLSYTTPKELVIRSWRLAALHQLSRLAILIYIAVYVIWWKKGYQGTLPVLSSTQIKFKGSSLQLLANNSTPQIWDAYDVVMPPKEENALFVTTGAATTTGQRRTTCYGNDVESESCNANRPCVNMKETLNGAMTGQPCNSSIGFCEIYAWCPLEPVAMKPALLQDTETSTIFLRSNARWPAWNISRNNVNGTVVTPGFNLFTVEDLVVLAGETFEAVRELGAVIAVNIEWNCDFDHAASQCNPAISAIRVDGDSELSVGSNYRYTREYYTQTADGSEELHRDLIKVWGLRFVFLVSGTGSQFDIVPLLVNIGSGLGLLALAEVLCDLIALRLLPQRRRYQTFKYEDCAETSMILDSNNNSDRERVPILR